MFVAALSEATNGIGTQLKPDDLTDMTSRVSPNGRYLAFMSERSLTGYENRDANSGEPDEEVFLYDASTGRLVCASCDPTGARPVGLRRAAANSTDARRLRPDNWKDRWLAANIPGWTAIQHLGECPVPVALSLRQRPAVLQQQRCARAGGRERQGGCL